ncbi:uncharacterized protein LOC124153272 [Ischnura elegans]|uniref:uncharacterized protein LOC124153272 n=1 Tax=Ischnura elegans TaxID=197161 RepID=UPI001ED8B960|nr:uncharacterized protein LOC124153272 [Ischnura elegans]
MLNRLSSAEDYYSAYSVPVGSDDDDWSEGGYETAAAEEDGAARSIALDVKTTARGEERTEPNGAHLKQILRTLTALDDCVWCTNAFTAERLKGGSGSSHTPQNLYPDEDIKKELEYIEFLCNTLLRLLLPLFWESGEEDGTDEKALVGRTWALISTRAPPTTSPLPGPWTPELLGAALRAIEAAGPDEGALRSLWGLLQEEGGPPAADTLFSLEHGFEWEEDLRRVAARVRCGVGLVNFLVLRSRERGWGLFLEREEHSIEETSVNGEKKKDASCGRLKDLLSAQDLSSERDLLSSRERWRAQVVRRRGADPSSHPCGIALPLPYGTFKSDTRATYYGIKRKNLLAIALQTADMTRGWRRRGAARGAFGLFTLLLSIGLYVADLGSDLALALDHLSRGNKGYSGLTLAFVLTPFLSETLSKLILKALSWDKEYGQLMWRDVFNFNDFKIIKWMACSVNYSVRSMLDYRRLAPSYAALHAHRRAKGRMEVRGEEEEEGEGEHIQRVFCSLLAWNERFTLQTKLAECLNESAPQLLLQLVIVFQQMASQQPIGFKTWFSIVTSTLSLSWSMHLSHFNRHYHPGGRVLNNSYQWRGRILELLGNCFVYGSRLVSLAVAASLFGLWFLLAASLYLIAVYLAMVFCSGRKDIYRALHRYKTTIFWPLHRLFTVPYRIGVWRMDSVDHALFYAEVAFLALLPPAAAAWAGQGGARADRDGADAWVVAGSLLASASLGAALLYAFKRLAHPYGYVCENR